MAESPWLAEVRRALGSRPDIMLWRQHSGTYAALREGIKLLKDAPKIKVAPDGIGDCMGVQMRRVDHPHITVTETVNPNGMQPHERPREWFYGQAIAVETKALKGKQRESQKDFEHAFRSMGGLYIVAHEGQWEVLWKALGEEPDELCAEHARSIWDAIQAERQEESANKGKRRA